MSSESITSLDHHQEEGERAWTLQAPSANSSAGHAEVCSGLANQFSTL